jgi:pimeloyl-ACP methyl ester carboxylesterase/tetratricopeptide (TPR) repeat protein
MKHLFLAILLLFPIAVYGQHSHAPAKEMAPVTLETGLGDINHPVSTSNPEAQKFFNQGLSYLYAFNHEEAIRSFKQAATLDPQLAMAYWGVALALGSNYNVPADGPALLEAYNNLQKAIQLAPKASEQDRAYINALSKRYSSDINLDRHKLEVDYKNAMGQLSKDYPDDLDAATLYAESMMDLRPWHLWSLDGKPAEDTLEIVATLEGVLRRNPNHSGANHYYIHAVEASTNAERALPSADRLGKIAPSAGHLVHMPSHVYIRTGDYYQAAKANVDAIAVDREYMTKSGNKGLYPNMYYNHNVHFLAAASAMNGRYADSIKNARELEANVKPVIKAMPMLEMFMPYPLVSMTRFGKWDDILKEPKPDPSLKIVTAFWHFARGSAYAASKDTAKAEAELAALKAVNQSLTPEVRVFNNTASDVTKVGELELEGKIALARGDKQAGIDLLNKSIAAEDATYYAEPADWDLPVREVLGGVLFANGDYSGAEKVFRAEILRRPRNGRALFGLAESLRKQGKEAAAKSVQGEYEKAWQYADTKLSVASLSGMSIGNDSAAVSGSEVQFASVILKTGVRLRYAYKGDPSGTPVIMLHGFTDSWFSFSRVLPLLDNKYRVYVLDQRGHGDSSRPVGGYAMEQFAADVIAFMDAMNLKQATIVGHSMGSFVAQHVASEAPERVTKLVLVASGTTLRNDTVRELQREIATLKDTAPVPETFARDFQASTIYSPVPAEFVQAVIKESVKVPVHVWREVVAELLRPEAEVQLKKIKTPTLIVWGDKESLFPRSEQDLLVSELRNSVFKVYPNTGHALHWERPERFAKDLQDFIN